MIKLKELCVNITDGEHGSVKDDENGNYFLLSNKNIINGKIVINQLDDRKISKETFDKINRRTKLEIGDILISTVGTIGKIAVIENEINFVVQRSVGIIKVNKEKLNSYYLKYQLMLPEFQRRLSNLSKGAVQKCLFIGDIEELLITVPSLSNQNQIANLLKLYDEKISINNSINLKLESMVKTIYDYWFLQFEFPNDEGKPYKSSGGKMVWNEELKREIPESWEVSKFDDIVDSAPSIQSIKAPDYKKIGKYPIIDQAEEYISGRTDDEYCVFKNSNNCVVFGDVTKYFKYVNFSFAKGTDGTKIVQSKNNRIPALLLYHLIKDIKLPNIGFARHYMYLREIKFIVPPLDICQKFTDIAEPLMNLKKHSHDEIYELINLRDFLLPLLMNGQVTFKGSKI